MDYAKDSAQSLLGSEAFQNFKPAGDLIWKSYILYAVLSAGCVIPWCTLIGGADYFQYRYPDTSIVRTLATAYLVGWLVSYVLFSQFGRQYTSWTRISTGLSISAVAMLAIPIMDAGFITSTHGSTATYWVTVAIAGISGAADATAQGSLLGIGAELPERILQAIVIGAGAAGVLIIIVRVVVKIAVSSMTDSVRYSAVFYFAIAALLLVLFNGAFIHVHRMPEMGYFDSLGLSNFDTMRLVLREEASVAPEISAGIAIATVAAGKSPSVQKLYYKPVMEKNYLLAVSMILIFSVTLFIFPGFLSSDMYSPTFHEGWYPVVFVGTYFVFDFLGRLLTAVYMPAKHSIYLAGAAIRLVVLIPIFVLSVVGPAIFSTDIAIIILTAVLAASSGFFIASLVIIMPKSVSAAHMEAAGVASASISVLASLIGITLSWLFLLARN